MAKPHPPLECTSVIARSAVETFAQRGAMAPTAGNRRAVAQRQPGVARFQWFDLGQVIEIDEVAAVHAHEARRVQPLLDRGHGGAEECSNYCTIARISHASKVMLKILQAMLQQYVNRELPDVQAGFRKGRRSEEHTSELQSPLNLVCRLLLEKKK